MRYAQELCPSCKAPGYGSIRNTYPDTPHCPTCDAPADRLQLLFDIGGYDLLGFELYFNATVPLDRKEDLLKLLEDLVAYGRLLERKTTKT